MSQTGILVNEALFEFLVELGADFVAAHALNLNEDALLGIVLQYGLAGFLELLETGAVRIRVVIGALDEGFASDVVAPRDSRGVEGGIVYPAGWFMDPATGDAVDDDGEGRL